MADLPPNPGHFRGQPARRWIDALVDWLTRDRIIVSPGSGLRITDTPAGRLLEGGGGGSGSGVLPIYTTGTISARSGGTKGSGTGVMYYTEDIAGAYTAVTLKSVFGSSLASGKYGWGRPNSDGTVDIVSLEC